ncbi:S8 family serine peptidase [Actinomadura rayongensis]|uniref:S8 family serine peptidase n=1 Tax=Actinomadura rayongensis TaxID=1429076 RepID=A0A6I4WCI8_9ACTN|nr:S8 family serine peptidase [Actinomadura rayongensis]
MLAALALVASGLAAPGAAADPQPRLKPLYDLSREKGRPGTKGPLPKGFSQTSLNVKFRTDRTVRLRDGKLVAANQDDTRQIQRVLADFPGATIRRLAIGSEQKVADQRAKVEKRTGQESPDFNSWYSVLAPAGIEKLLGRLNALPSVEIAEAAPKAKAVSEPLRPFQRYRNAVGAAGGTGIEADAINGVPGGKGDGITVGDSGPGADAVLTATLGPGHLTVGTRHTAIVAPEFDGDLVWTWGDNTHGQLGTGTTTNSAYPVRVPGLVNVVAVAAGGDYTLALKDDGTVWAWGDNAHGQLGDGTTTERHTPVQVSGITTAKAIAAGPGGHALAVLADGTVRAWGANGSGQLGNGTTTESHIPVTVSGLSGVATTAGAISAGTVHSLAVKTNGTVVAWGGNGFGQLGNGTTTGSTTPVTVSGLSTATQVSAGTGHSITRLADGTVRTWGLNGSGQLGNGSTTSSSTPVAVAGLSGIASVAGGGNTSAADGASSYMWGANSAGQYADGTTTGQNTPALLSGRWDATAVGTWHAVHTRSASVYASGSNTAGQLGTGNTNNSTFIVGIYDRKNIWNLCHEEFTGRPGGAPVNVLPLVGPACNSRYDAMHGTSTLGIIAADDGNGKGISGLVPNAGIQLSTSNDLAAAAAALNAGDVLDLEWGIYNSAGDGLDPAEASTYYYQVILGAVQRGVSVIEPATNEGIDLDDPSDPGGAAVMARPDSGAIMVGAGAPPRPSGADCPGPSAPAERSKLDFSDYGSRVNVQAYGECAATTGVDAANDLTPTETDPNRQYWYFSGTSSATPIVAGAVAALQGIAKKYGTPLEPRQLRQLLVQTGTPQTGDTSKHIGPQPNLRAAVSYLRGGLAVGNSHGVSVRNDGSVWAWGLNSSGQLGNGTTVNSTSGVQVSGLSGVVRAPGAVAAGQNHSLAVRGDGTVWAWGANGSGQLGNGTTANSSVPVQVSGLSGVKAVAAGLSFSLALKSDGTVWAWGANASGQLGNGTTTGSSTPVQVSGISDAAVIGAGSSHGLAVRADGTVKAWGANSNGQLGNGANTNSSAPVTVSGLSGVSTWAGALAGGFAHSVALLADGTVRAWGLNNYGQLGNGSTASSNIPVAVSGLSGVATVGAGGWHSVASGTSGVSTAWGMNTSGQLGDGSTTSSSTPVVVSDWGPLAGVAAGGSSTTGTTPAGIVFAWGLNSSGQLGDGTTTNRSTPVFVNDLP